MKQISASLLALSLLTAPALAQQEEETSPLSEGWQLLSEGSRLLLEGMAEEMRPLVDQHLVPMIARLAELMDDVALYELPQVLPNGDIIIRRREPLTPEEEDPTRETGEPIDL